MTEQTNNFIDSLEKVTTYKELKAILPPSVTSKLGNGETGVTRTIELLEQLHMMGTIPFSRESCLNTIGWDTSGDSLPEEEIEKMFDVGLETGLIKPEKDSKDKYVVDPIIRKINKVFYD